MKKIILFLLMFTIMVFGVSGAFSGSTETRTSWITNDFLNDNDAQPGGRVLINDSWTNFTISNCLLQTQPLVYDLYGDSRNEIVVYCNNTGKTKIYEDDGTLIDEVSIGVLLDNLAITIDDGLTHSFGGVYQNGADINITQIGFNGTNLNVIDNFDKNLRNGLGNTIMWTNEEGRFYAFPQTTIEIDLFTDNNLYYCHHYNNTLTYGFIVCYDNAKFNNTPVLNTTIYRATTEYIKLFATNWDGGDSEIIVTSGYITKTETHYIDSTGSILWSKEETALQSGTPHFGASFLYGYQVCNVHHRVYSMSALSEVYCYDFSGAEVFSSSFSSSKNILFSDYMHITTIDYDNDGDLEFLVGGVINEIDQINPDPLNSIPAKHGNYSIAVDVNKDGSLDYTDSDGNTIFFYINGYTNQPPTIDQYTYNTGNPICLYSSIVYEITFTDVEGDYAKLRIDRYGDGNYSGYGDLAGYPSQVVTYDKLGTFTSVLELTDESNNVVTTTHGVIVQTSNCFTSGESSGTSTASTNASEIICTGIFCTQQGDIDGYQSNIDIYNSNNSIYIDEQRCIDAYGTNYKQMFIPCFVRLSFVDVIDQLEIWIITSFIAVIIVLIGFFLIMIIKHKK